MCIIFFSFFGFLDGIYYGFTSTPSASLRTRTLPGSFSVLVRDSAAHFVSSFLFWISSLGRRPAEELHARQHFFYNLEGICIGTWDIGIDEGKQGKTAGLLSIVIITTIRRHDFFEFTTYRTILAVMAKAAGAFAIVHLTNWMCLTYGYRYYV